MTGLATIYTPLSWSPAVELAGGSRLWRKKVLPVGDISYQGRTLHFTPAYIAGLERAFRDNAYDQVSFQLADSQNSHTNDPERHRGTIVDMKAEEDGLWITLEPTPRGESVLRENPYLGVSCRIVEQYSRSDGRFYPAAVQHLLGTLDPRIPGLGAWAPVDMANSPAVTIDLSGSSWAAEPGPELTPSELADLLDAISETDEEEAAGLLPGDTGEMTDAELDAIISAAEAEDGMTYDALGDFNDAFTARAQADQARSDARAAAIVQDTLRLARRDEDRLARAVSRAQAGVYDTPAALGFALQSPAIELAVQTGRGMCGVPDELGRCSARYHDLECVYGTGVDWLAAGAPRETFQASLSNWAGGLNLSGQPMTIWDDPDDEDDVRGLIPASTVELAHQLSHDWGLDIDAPFIGAAGLDDVSLIRPPTAPVNAYDAMAESIGYGAPPPPALTRPGISELARDLGLR